MLTKYDEFLCHQIVSTFDHPATSAREWTERTWFCVHDTEGKVILVNSFGYYPNRNIIDTYVSITVEGKTVHTVRASRELRPAVDETVVGPFSYEIVEPLRKVKSSLDENEYGVSYDITFDGTFPPHEEDPQFARVKGRVEEHIVRYVQVGRPSGWIKVEGKTYQVDHENWRCERDHSWGVRRGGGVPEVGVQPGDIPTGYMHNFITFQFENWGMTFHRREDWDSTPLMFSGAIFYPADSGKPEVPLLDIEHNYSFRSDIRQLTGAEIKFTPAEGPQFTVTARPLIHAYLKAGGMFGFRDFVHGMWMGPYFIDGHKIDLTDPQQLAEVHFIEDMASELRCGDETGYGIVEVVLIGKYPKYGYEGF
ncbi:MAG: hypothetical protein R6U89_12580 [Dehalococcoidia bacterium]